MFEVTVNKGMFRPGDPIHQDHVSMGLRLGTNIRILYNSHGEQKSFKIVDMANGDTILVNLINTERDAKDLWDRMSEDAQNSVVGLLVDHRKIEAIRTIRQDTDANLMEAKRLIDSTFIWDIALPMDAAFGTLKNFLKKETKKGGDA